MKGQSDTCYGRLEKQTVQGKSEDEGNEQQARGHSPYGGPVLEARPVFIQTADSTD